MARASWLAIAAVAVVPGLLSVQAVELPRSDFQGASGLCKASTPAFAASVRYRPLGLANESDSAIYVTCNWQGDDSQSSVRGARRVYVVISNFGGDAQDVTCTLVNGFQSGANVQATYTPKTVNIAAGAGATIEWLPADVPGSQATIKLPAVSCVLPGNSTLQHTGKEYNEDVGA